MECVKQMDGRGQSVLWALDRLSDRFGGADLPRPWHDGRRERAESRYPNHRKCRINAAVI
jgi:hypothetical protein